MRRTGSRAGARARISTRSRKEREEKLLERTLSIIKPDAVAAGHAGEILARIEKAGFRIAALRMRRLGPAEAEGFYHVHRGRPFFTGLCAFMSSGPCLTLVLERENAIAGLRELMGATDPAEAAAGTLRREFASSIERNAIHGSDGTDTAQFEIGYFFPGVELV
jgi:nucleoside-diphosphate kinase